MSDTTGTPAVTVRELAVPPDVQRAVEAFAGEVLALAGPAVASIVAFGSAVTGDFDPGESDVNLLVVYETLEIEDVEKVGAVGRKWLKQKMLAPRFLSRRNFEDYLTHFPVDVLAMRGASIVLAGRDLLGAGAPDLRRLRWQAAYEVKAMRFRIKQQFWRISDNDAAMARVLAQRFTSLTHLMRAALMLQGLPAPARRTDVVAAAIASLGLDAAFAARMADIRHARSRPDRKTLIALFGDLLDAIRIVDGAVGDPA